MESKLEKYITFIFHLYFLYYKEFCWVDVNVRVDDHTACM